MSDGESMPRVCCTTYRHAVINDHVGCFIALHPKRTEPCNSSDVSFMLWLICEIGNVECFKFAIENGYPSFQPIGVTAASRGKLKILEYLFEHGDDTMTWDHCFVYDFLPSGLFSSEINHYLLSVQEDWKLRSDGLCALKPAKQ